MRTIIYIAFILAPLIVIIYILGNDFCTCNTFEERERERHDEVLSLSSQERIRSSYSPDIDELNIPPPKTVEQPIAVQVVSPEEADKLNTFAHSLSTAPKRLVEGEIIERSELPDPRSVDYPDCRFTAHFIVNAIKSGEPCPQEIALILEGIEDHRILKTDNLKKGDKVLCQIIPFNCLPEEFQSMQQADDLNLHSLENYYVLGCRKIDAFTAPLLVPKSGFFFSDGNSDYRLSSKQQSRNVAKATKN